VSSSKGTAATYDTFAAGPMFYEESEDRVENERRETEALRRHAREWHARLDLDL